MSFKRTKVVMLPTEKSSDIILRTRDNVIHQRKYYGTAWEDMGDVYQHLYFLSDDGIKEGDWVLLANNSIVKAVVGKYELDTIIGFNTGIGNVVKRFSKSDRKIIATTDKNLIWLDKSEKNPELARPNGLWKCLPQPSEGFIQKFVDSYNSRNPITEVMVEYDFIRGVGTEFGYKSSDIDSLKINPKDNTITTRKVKDVWTRDEVVDLFNKMYSTDIIDANVKRIDFDKWVEENL